MHHIYPRSDNTVCTIEGRSKEKEGKRGTITKMKERDKAWKKYRQYPSGTNFEAYRTIQNKVSSLIREDEDHDRKRILQNFRGKTKSFYGYMRTLQTVKSNVTILRQDNGDLTTTDQEAADILAGYFREAFTQPTGRILQRSVHEGGLVQLGDCCRE